LRKVIVAVVGRPNVGKSTLFNTIAGKQISIVQDTPGVTRDRIYAEGNWLNYYFTMVDTGGIEPISDDVLDSMNPEDFPFVKNLTISGDNDSHMVEVQAEIMDNVSNDAIIIFLDQLMREISTAGAVQDFRYTKPTENSYGSFFQRI